MVMLSIEQQASWDSKGYFTENVRGNEWIFIEIYTHSWALERCALKKERIGWAAYCCRSRIRGHNAAFEVLLQLRLGLPLPQYSRSHIYSEDKVREYLNASAKRRSRI